MSSYNDKGQSYFQSQGRTQGLQTSPNVFAKVTWTASYHHHYPPPKTVAGMFSRVGLITCVSTREGTSRGSVQSKAKIQRDARLPGGTASGRQRRPEARLTSSLFSWFLQEAPPQALHTRGRAVSVSGTGHGWAER